MMEDSYMYDASGSSLDGYCQQVDVKFSLASDQELPLDLLDTEQDLSVHQPSFSWLLSEQPLMVEESFDPFNLQFQQQPQQQQQIMPIEPPSYIVLEQKQQQQQELEQTVPTPAIQQKKSKKSALARRLHLRASRQSQNNASISGGAGSDNGGLIEQSQICCVCGDTATGFHYSALTCEACKSFFKRTVQDKHNYTCCGNYDCSVNRSLRKTCQYCRFQKCLQNGMQPMEVRMDHTRGGRRKCKRTSREQFERLVDNIASHPSSNNLSTAAKSKTKSQRQIPDSNMLLRDFILDIESAHIAQCQVPIELPLPNWLAVEVRTPSAFRLAVRHWFRRGLQSVVRWSRSLSCLAALPRRDLCELLHENWLAVLAIDTLAWSQPFDGTIRFGSNFSLRREDLGNYQPLSDFYCTMQSMFCSLDSLQLNVNELAVLKLVALLDQSVADRLIDAEALGPLSGAAMRALYSVCAEKLISDPSSPEVDDYIGRLLMRLGFTVNLRHGCRVWTSLDPPACAEARELIETAMDEQLNPNSKPQQQQQQQHQFGLRRQEGSSGSFCLSSSSSSASLLN